MKEIDKKIHELILGFTSKDYPIDSSYGLKDVTKGVKLILKAQRAKDKELISKVREWAKSEIRMMEGYVDLEAHDIYSLEKVKELKQILEGK